MMIIINTALIISIISTVLASIISIVDYYVNNYGEVDININNGKKILNVKGGSSLLSTLASTGIFVPSACGGRGSCGACKVKVTSDVGPVLPTEKPYLTKDELNNNIRLSCQIKIKSNINIELPPRLFNIKKFKGKIEKITDLTYDIKEIRIQLNEPNDISFEAGQYVQLVVPPYDKIKTPTQRAYSISSAPKDKNILELIIRLVPNGIATTYVHKFLKENDKIEFVGPFGDFVRQDTKADMICAAGGSGMAPIKSIINDMINKNIMDRNIWYFFGANTYKDMYFKDELEEISKQYPNFHFVPSLSSPKPEDNWQGEVGIITNVIEKYLQNIITKDSQKEGYLCGSPGMIDACVNVYTKYGIEPNKIYYDKFA